MISPERLSPVPRIRLRLAYLERLAAAREIRQLSRTLETTYFDPLLHGLCYWESWYSGQYLSILAFWAPRHCSQGFCSWFDSEVRGQVEFFESPDFWSEGAKWGGLRFCFRSGQQWG